MENAGKKSVRVSPDISEKLLSPIKVGEKGQRRAAKPDGRKTEKSTTPPYGMMLLILLVVAAIAVVPFLILRPKTQATTVFNYQTALVKTGSIAETAVTQGQLVPVSSSEMTATINGVLSIRHKEGDRVGPGELLAVITSPNSANEKTQSQLATYQLRMQRAEIQRQHNSRIAEMDGTRQKLTANLSRVQAAIRQSASSADAVNSRQQADQYRQELAALDRQRTIEQEYAAQALNLNQDMLTATQQADQRQATAGHIYSPLGGTIVKINAKPQQLIASGQSLITVADLSKFYVDTMLTSTMADQLKTGEHVTLVIGNRHFPAKISQLGYQASGDEGDVEAKITPTVPLPQVRPGGSVTVQYTLRQAKNVVIAPQGPYLNSAARNTVYVIVAPDRAERREVVFGIAGETGIEVRSGVKAGERILTSSYEQFVNDAVVQLAPTQKGE